MPDGKTQIWCEVTTDVDGTVVVDSHVECPRRGRCHLWYRIPSEFASVVSRSLDAIVVGNIFLIMSEGADCVVHGQVSPSLLRNLDEFQSAWSSWCPNKYGHVEITADKEAEDSPADRQESAVAAFTGGVDSCFTMFKHRTGRCSRWEQRSIDAGLFVHGFDIPLSQPEAFQRASERLRRVLDTVGSKLITMSSNLQELNIEWNYTHVAGIASSLMLLKRRYSHGLIASGCSYENLMTPWGSNPITDHLLSSDSFSIVHDGAGVRRARKIKEVSRWEEGFRNLRVCYSASNRDENCGTCVKCLFLILFLHSQRIPVPPSFPPVHGRGLETLTEIDPAQLEGLKSLSRSAREAGFSDSWLKALDRRLNELGRKPIEQVSAR